MDYKQIDELKTNFMNMVKQGKVIGIPAFNIKGRIVGVGFKPYWTTTYDSRIDRIELNILNENGRIIPFYFNYIVGYDTKAEETQSDRDSKKAVLDLHVYSIKKSRDTEPFEKIRIEVDQ